MNILFGLSIQNLKRFNSYYQNTFCLSLKLDSKELPLVCIIIDLIPELITLVAIALIEHRE